MAVVILAISMFALIASWEDNEARNNCRYENLPYETTENYWDTEPRTKEKCDSVEYQAKAEYYNEYNGNTYDINLIYSLFYSDGKPNTETSTEYRIKNYEDKLGSFGIKVNFVDNKNDYIESYIYDTIDVGPKETEYRHLYYGSIWRNKPGSASAFYVTLVKPTLQECKNVTELEQVFKSKPVVKYREQRICD